jgi:hypothetical protein
LAGFHIGWFVMATVDTKASQKNIEVLYSCLKTTSAKIDVSARQPALLHLLGKDLILSLCRHWLSILKTKMSIEGHNKVDDKDVDS